MDLYFADVFRVSPRVLARYGAFNVSLISDLPLFVDPFLVFNSRKPAYRKLHREIVRYLKFLYRKAQSQSLTPGLIDAWYRFPEIEENWLGFSETGNKGRGLGPKFAAALHGNLNLLLGGLNSGRVAKDVHLEKLCLINDRVGKDNVSDFTTNLIHGFLLKYTEAFARKHIDRSQRRLLRIRKARFNYQTETWQTGSFDLPIHQGKHILLTPEDLLTKDDTWINRTDLYDDFERIPEAIPNVQLRQQISNYFRQLLPRKRRKKAPTKGERNEAARQTVQQFPELIDYYIRSKEDRGSEAKKIASRKVEASNRLYIRQIKQLRAVLERRTEFYGAEANSYEAAHRRAMFLKDVIENKGCHKIFYVDGQPIERESDLQILYRFTWFGTGLVLTREANDGRGPADYKVSSGTRDHSLVEMKLGSNPSLERNLKNQTGIYERASDATQSVKIIICFSVRDQRRVTEILKRLKLEGDSSIVVVDARIDNKPSGSKA